MTDTPERIQTSEGKSRLIKHFEKSSINNHNEAWTNLWETNNDDMWDRGKPSPALINLIEQRPDILSPITADGRRKKVLIPGCGKGYDVVMLALHGFNATGLEISAKGVATAERYAREEFPSPQSYNFGSSTSRPEKGSVSFIQGDFFADSGEKFDVIYDYTFLCALHPSMRARWAGRMADLLVSGGMLVCLEFPLFKDPRLTGPPWPLQGVYWDLLAEGGDGIVYPPKAGVEDQRDPRTGQFDRMLYVKPEISYESGKGSDMLSVYVRK